MRKILLNLIIFTWLFSCKQQEADLIITNANVYTVNANFGKAESFAIKDGKFLAVGSNKEITNKYQSINHIDAQKRTVLPGFIDAHCHFFDLGLQQQKVDLSGTKSYDEVLEKLVTFQKEKELIL